ncbi:MAG: DNA mismatch repair endonuclease MutL [Clostridia bacterium]|nr:DNA mismatch repair endonuclease MutL [Clostridia bacterium]
MPKINVLPKSLAELIAAGEVVERPASVVKELLENSIDAGAKNITVEIKNGGISYIRITDDGSGIEREDIRNAFLSHATSKISTSEDLNSIFTLGFRGEALASVAAVSKVEVLTRTADEEFGTRYCIESGEEVLLDDAGCPLGTTIVVRDLFYSTPARMKFLKKDVTEGNTVAGVVDRTALSHPEISFRFIREGRQTLITGGKNNLLSTIREVIGKDFADSLIPASSETDGVKVSGYISVPHYSRPNRNMQFFFINGRQIKTGTGSAALSEAYKNSIMVGKFPSCVLNLEISPNAVDVNVHPAKTEVRFSNEKAVFNAVYFACKNALTQDTSRVQYSSKPAVDFYAPIETAPEQIKIESSQPKPGFWNNISVKEVKPEIKNETASPVFSTVEPVGLGTDENDIPSLIPDLTAAKPIQSDVTEIKKEIPAADNSFDEENFRLIGEAFKTYIIVEYRGKLVVIDKHAAHERMIYEKLKATQCERTAQSLLSPVTVTLTKEEYSAVVSNAEFLAEAGFDISDYGDGVVAVNECPMELSSDDIPGIISEIAGRFTEKKMNVDYDRIDDIFHSVACRSAIKSGDFTSVLEMERFAKKLLSMPSIRYCPHGRPVLIEITRRELEKNFGRI